MFSRIKQFLPGSSRSLHTMHEEITQMHKELAQMRKEFERLYDRIESPITVLMATLISNLKSVCYPR